MSDTFAKEILEAHNNYREAHGVPPLKWCKHAASEAKSWAKKMADKEEFKHGGHYGMGQNLARRMSARNPDMTGQQAVDIWYREIKDYDFDNPEYSDSIGHFSQVVWADTTEVGAAKVIRGNYCYVVANFRPPGNMRTKEHFEKNVKKLI